MEKSLQPAPDEVEISIFGPGYGECVIIHPGDNNWIIVDSCVDPLTGVPAALSYFSRIEVNPAQDVKQVIASHWHDDHVRGIGKVYSVCKSAEFVCSEAINSDEFLNIVEIYSRGIMTESPTGIDDFKDVLYEIARRAKESGSRPTAPRFAVADKCLWSCYMEASKVDCNIYSLSPSDTALIMSKLDIKKLLPKAKEAERSLLPFSENRSAVALMISIGGLHALLGADLEATGDQRVGWSAIVNSSTRPKGRASAYKISHHGSKNAHHDKVWSDLLEKEPVAVLTPFSNGFVNLPTENDVKRICSFTSSAFITVEKPSRRHINRDKTVEKTIKELALKLRSTETKVGHVRLRARQGGSWVVDLFDGAGPLCKNVAERS